MRKIIHIDMDAFYASVEALDDPMLKDKPVIVGGNPERRGVVAAASYEARACGVRSAMPMRTAVRLCPDGLVVPPRMKRYREVAEALWAIHHAYTDLVEPLALDECYLDVTRNMRNLPSATAIAQALKAEIREQVGLTASAGVAPNKFLAKIASDLEKPDGLVVIKPAQVQSFIQTLEVGKLGGVGPVNEKKLHAIDVRTVGELSIIPEQRLTELFGKFGHTLHQLSQGIDERAVVPDREAKQVSTEITFEDDTADPTLLRRELTRQAENILRRMTARDTFGKTVTLKVRYEDFTSITRSCTRLTPYTKADEIVEETTTLLAKTDVGLRRVRLIGIGVSNFAYTQPIQLEIPFPEFSPAPTI